MATNMAETFMGVRVVISERGLRSGWVAADFVSACHKQGIKIRYLKVTVALYRQLRVQSLIL